jgi:ribosomal protein S3AE
MAKAVLQKNWYNVQAPSIFDEDEVAETPAEKESQVVGRRVREGLNDLMDSTDKYYADVTLKVTDVEGNKAFTEIDEMSVSSEYVSRMVREGSDRFDYVYDLDTADDRRVRIKFVGATLRRTSSKKLTAVRNKIKEILEEKGEEQSYEEIMENIFTDNLQDEIRDEVDTIYPFRQLEIRKTELLE